jgi:hypothetical protein
MKMAAASLGPEGALAAAFTTSQVPQGPPLGMGPGPGHAQVSRNQSPNVGVVLLFILPEFPFFKPRFLKDSTRGACSATTQTWKIPNSLVAATQINMTFKDQQVFHKCPFSE